MDSKQRQDEIIAMFNDIAPTYDAANRLLSMGIDIKWRKEACKQALQLLNKSNVDIADIACGTGDMMKHWRQATMDKNISLDSMVGIDPSESMLSLARQKIHEASFIIGQADSLPLESSSLDLVSIAYGLRNVVNRIQALGEFHRILRPGGLLVILEFTSQSGGGGLASTLMRLYTRFALPLVGGLISRNYKAYKYLPKSIDGFLTKESLEAELLAKGLKSVFSKSYSADISTLVIAQKG